MTAAWVERPGTAHVLAALPKVVYLQVGPRHTDVLPIEAADGIGLPTSLRLAEPARTLDWNLEQGDRITISPGQLHLPGWTIRVTRRWRPLSVRTVAAAPDRAWVERQWGSLPPAAPIRLGGQLVGAGRGLTPSGDDHLCGALLAWRAVGREADRTALWSVIRPRLAGTTGLSASLLTAAASGYAVPSVRDWIGAVVTQDADALARAVPGVLALGHSSGQDVIRGALTALGAPSRSAAPTRPAVPSSRPTSRLSPAAGVPA